MKYMIIVLAVLLIFIPSCGEKTTSSSIPTNSSTTHATTSTTTPSGTTTTTPTAILPPTTTSSTTVTAPNKGFIFASTMATMFYDWNAIQTYYNDGAAAMSGFQIGSGTAAVISNNGVKQVVHRFYAYEGVSKQIPPEFSQSLPPDGYIPAPPGACPAAAEPFSRFITEGGDIVTPELLATKGVITLPVDMVNVSQNDPSSLESVMRQLVPMNDTRLATAAGWNTLLWDKLKAMQVPAESLMDYQMWTLSAELEQEVVGAFRQSLANSGVPAMVLNAFDTSANSGWYAAVPPTPVDALAQMDIKATLTGSVSGTVHEWRDFSIPGLGEAPVFGTQYGDGTVYFEQVELGRVECTVAIELNEYDEMGRATGGTVVATPVGDTGYKVVFTYKPDGSKDGIIYDKDGNEVGYLTMTVDHDKFTNYVDVKAGTEIKIPTPTTTVFQ